MGAKFTKFVLVWILALASAAAFGQQPTQSPPPAAPVQDYTLGAGDTIHILVFQNPDLTLDTRVSERGTITYPLIGSVSIGGLTISAAEKKIANALSSGGFVKGPQVNISVTQIIGNQVAVLGYVNRPGSYPLLTANTHLTQLLATAGGILVGPTSGANRVIVEGERDGRRFRREVNIASIYLDDHPEDDLILAGGDSLYVPKAEVFYIYGQVNRPGQYPLERNMTVMQALAAGGGQTLRGSENRIRLSRRQADGTVATLSPALTDPVQYDDVIFVNESFF